VDEPGTDRDDVARARMVADQLRGRGIHDHRVLAAMEAVHRHAFVHDVDRAEAYADKPLPIGGGQTISQPYIVARMTELLAVRPGDRVLDVGTGSGYQAAILAELGCLVTSIERDEGLADAARLRMAALGYEGTITVKVGDGSLGDPAGAPWDGIVVAAAAPRVPDSLRGQLADGGRLVIPVGGRHEQRLLLIQRRGDDWVQHDDGACVFVLLIGAEGWPS
jgi:protein-L-isoaspartate(D-aspartate) O-methyltransferase